MQNAGRGTSGGEKDDTGMAVLRTIVWFFYFFGALIALIPKMNEAKRRKAAGDEAGCRAIVDKCVPGWMSALMRIAGCTVTVNGLENIPKDRAVVFTPNHQGDYDIPITLVHLDRPHALVAKVETLKIPLVRTWMKLFDCVFIDRKNPRQAVTAMKEAGALLARGESVIVFPEGTRSRGDAMGEFKHGAFKMAFAANAPVVPVVIDGSYKIMEANHNLMRPGHVTLTVLPPIETAGMDRAAQKALPDEVARRIAAVKDKPKAH